MANKRKKGSLAHLLTEEKLKEEHDSGLSWRKIAKKYKCSSQQIEILRKQYGWEIKSRANEDDAMKLRPKSELYIAYENLDLSFFKQEVEDVKEMWKAGIHFTDMVNKLKRNYLEVLALITDLIDKGKLETRRNRVIGEV